MMGGIDSNLFMGCSAGVCNFCPDYVHGKVNKSFASRLNQINCFFKIKKNTNNHNIRRRTSINIML